MLNQFFLNHLWQSTLFAGFAALLTLALRKNQARTRYWVWLAASLKFLLPFSLLMLVGRQLDWPARPDLAHTRLSVAMQQASQPFSDTDRVETFAAAAPRAPSAARWWLLAWAAGFAAVSLRSYLRWRSVRAIVRVAAPLPLPVGIEARSSRALLEPGVFGIFRPILLLPQGIADRLTPGQLRSIIAHEMCHVRRRDNLAAALHMTVEALFWFHPLVWWLGARLVEERERACDEEVLRKGNDPGAYAQGILKVCEFYLESPRECVAGVSGANLQRRIEEIMTNRIVQKLNFGRKLLLAGAGMLAVAVPIAIGVSGPQMQAQSRPAHPAFEVTSVKPFRGDPREMRGAEFNPGGRFTFKGPLLLLISVAYNIPIRFSQNRFSGIPGWVKPDSPDGVFEIEATAPKGAFPPGLSQQALVEEERSMLQALLADRFKMTVRRESKEMPIYALTVGKGGPKLPSAGIQEKDCAEVPAGGVADPGKIVCHQFTGGRGRGLHGRAVDVADLVSFVQNWTDRPVFDKTGIKGLYRIETEPFQPMELGATAPAAGAKQDGVLLADLPTLFTVFERLGLRMESQKGRVDTYVIEHIEKPAEN